MADLRSLRPGRRLHDAPIRRHRARARHLLAARRADGRPNLDRERSRSRQQVPFRRPLRGAARSCPTPAQPAGSASLERLRVLVVDDNATNRRILEEMLRSWRMNPAAVEGAVPAPPPAPIGARRGRPVSSRARRRPHARRRRLQLAQEIKGDARLASVSLIMLTSAALPEVQQRACRTAVLRPVSANRSNSPTSSTPSSTRSGPPAAAKPPSRRASPAPRRRASRQGLADPRGRRQPDQSEAGRDAARAAGPPRGCRLRRKASAGPMLRNRPST